MPDKKMSCEQKIILPVCQQYDKKKDIWKGCRFDPDFYYSDLQYYLLLRDVVFLPARQTYRPANRGGVAGRPPADTHTGPIDAIFADHLMQI